jgi:hydrogenase/urease accessory protein HupE
MHIGKTLSLAIAVLVAGAVPAFAHAGDHTHVDFLGAVVHVLTQPDHLLPLAAAAGVIVVTLTKPAALMRVMRGLTSRKSR